MGDAVSRSQLPDRPDLRQLRRQAKELQRAAARGDAVATTRLRAVGDRVTLSAAQLALAREYGFASWPRLKAEVDRRRAAAAPMAAPRDHQPAPEEPPDHQPAPEEPRDHQPAPEEPRDHQPAPEEPRSWRDMRERSARLLLERTGEGVEAWNLRIAERDLADEAALRAWLTGQGVTGYAQMLLVMERFGYPDFLLADAEQLLDGQYADRPHLRPILESVLASARSLGPVTVQARKTYVSLVSPRRTFAVVKASTRRRVDLGLRLDGQQPGGRLQDGRRLGNGTINVRVALASPADLDDEVVALLRRAYEANT
jgi:hypothetical protein